MHRVHHSAWREETDSNYGFFLPVWDRLFRTYNAQPRMGHEQMQIGPREFSVDQSLRLGWLLLQPFMNAGRDT